MRRPMKWYTTRIFNQHNISVYSRWQCGIYMAIIKPNGSCRSFLCYENHGKSSCRCSDPRVMVRLRRFPVWENMAINLLVDKMSTTRLWRCSTWYLVWDLQDGIRTIGRNGPTLSLFAVHILDLHDSFPILIQKSLSSWSMRRTSYSSCVEIQTRPCGSQRSNIWKDNTLPVSPRVVN